MTQIATDPSQSARLIACGVDPKTADMYLSVNLCEGGNYGKFSTHILGNDYLSIENIVRMRDYCPAWSLSALLALLPKDLMWQGLYYRLVMGPDEKGWEIEYNDLSVLNNLHRVMADNLIEAVVLMIERLTKEGYKLNEIKQ